MLFVALTRSRVLDSLPPDFTKQFSVAPGWFLTVGTDNFLSRLAVSDLELVASESLLASSEARDLDIPFVTARFLRSEQLLRISKSTVSGRPVFYSVTSKGEFFLSTHLSWLRRAGLPLEEDPSVLPELLAFRVVGPPKTLFRGIRQLSLAGSIVVQIAGADLHVKEGPSGYEPPHSAGSSAQGDPVGTVADLLNASIGRLMPVAPSVATLLSGGVDSSLLGATARDVLSACDTYSTSYPFDSPSTNGEQKYALSAASALSTRHTLFTPTANDYLTGFVEALANAEQPLHHLQSVLLHLLFKSGMPDRMDRIICGEAADTAFGLQRHFTLRLFRDLRGKIYSLPPVYASLRALGSYWQRARDLSGLISQSHDQRRPLTDPLNPLWSYAAYGDFEWIRTHYGASHEDIVAPRMQNFKDAGNWSFNDALSIHALNSDVTNTASVWSKLAEQQGKILYFPFTSADMLDAAFSISWETKLKSDKYVVREVGRRLGVPELILTRPKQSFGIMSNRWAVKGGALEPLISVAAKVVDIKQLRSLQGTEPGKAMTLWSLLNYAVLKRLFVMGENKQSLIDEVVENCDRQNGRSHQTRGENYPKISAAVARPAAPSYKP